MAMGPREIFLQPGELCFGGGELRIRTVLGSCVSMVFWHPLRRIGGMCHYLLPHRVVARTGDLDGRYADEALEVMLRHMRAWATDPHAYTVKLIGGGNMFPGVHPLTQDGIGVRNIEAARALIAQHGFQCVHEHLDGAGHRNVSFDVRSGEVRVRFNALPPAPATKEEQPHVHH